jgi:DNA replication protein DnaC
MAQTIKQIYQQGSKSGMAIERIKYDFKIKQAANTWLDIYKKHVGDVKIGKDAKAAWNSLIFWAMGHEYKLDLSKSIGLVGMTGSGKTMTMYVLNDFINIDEIKYRKGEDLVNLRFKFESSLVMAGDFSRKGYDALYKYSNYANLCIDDLGAENTNKKHFGDAANVIQEVIEMRHSNGFLTHFTSNLTTEMIQQVYGDRVYSRLIGDTNIIKLNDCDYRLQENK